MCDCEISLYLFLGQSQTNPIFIPLFDINPVYFYENFKIETKIMSILLEILYLRSNELNSIYVMVIIEFDISESFLGRL